MRKLIETAIPLSTINQISTTEKTSATGHPANLHMWWGRSPQYASLFSLVAATVDAGETKEELLARIERAKSNTYTQIAGKPIVFDPFCGYGGIPLAAEQLGFPVVAGDLNPVAVMLTKAAVEIPAAFADCSPVNQLSLKNNYRNAAGLAEDVQYYGEWLLSKAAEKLKALYPNEDDGVPAAWIWARTVKCPNPACGCMMPLASSFILNGKSGKEMWAEPVVEAGKVHFEIRNGVCPKEKITNKFGNYGARFTCPACGEITADEYVKQQGLQHKLGAQMMAVVLETQDGRIIKAPSEAQESAADVPVPENVPQGEIPNNAHWFSPPGFGLTEYADLFSPRQMTMLTTFCDLLLEVQNKAASDALAAGMSHEGGSLADGGKGALAYGQAISVYLAFIIDKMADRNTTVCSWNSSGGNPRATFGRQAIPMVWNYAEVNPFTTMTGNFRTALKNVVTAIANLPCGNDARVVQGDAVTSEYPENTLVCTELPYYKTIGYAHLSDFFYIWMRRSLKPVFPELFNPMVTSKQELSTVGQFYGRPQEECDQEYEAGLRVVFKKLYQASNPDYPSLLFFEYHKADDDAIYRSVESTGKMTAWENMLDGLIQAGFAVTAVWPMRSEAASDKADGVRVLLVVRRQEKTEQTTRRGFISTLKRELPDRVETAFCAGVDECDKGITAMGCGLSVFTRYKKVLNADGTNMSVHDALQIIGQETKELITAIDDETDKDGAVSKED